MVIFKRGRLATNSVLRRLIANNAGPLSNNGRFTVDLTCFGHLSAISYQTNWITKWKTSKPAWITIGVCARERERGFCRRRNELKLNKKVHVCQNLALFWELLILKSLKTSAEWPWWGTSILFWFRIWTSDWNIQMAVYGTAGSQLVPRRNTDRIQNSK